MIKRFFCLLFLVFFANNAFTEEIYISPKISLKNSLLKEYLYTKNHKTSQLDWKIDNSPSFGFEADFVFERLFFGFDFSYGFYNFSGKMEDFDWLDYENPNHVVRYSCHNLILSEDLDFSIDFGFHFPLDNSKKNFGKMFLQFDFWRTFVSGHDGWRYYEDWESSGNASGIFEGKVITYNPTIFSVLFGFGGNYYLGNKFSVNLDFLLGLISSGTCVDNHIKAVTIFEDKVKGSFFLKGNLYFGFDFSKKNTLIFGGKINYLPPIFGESYANGILSSQIGGFSSFSYEFYLSYRIRIL